MEPDGACRECDAALTAGSDLCMDCAPFVIGEMKDAGWYTINWDQTDDWIRATIERVKLPHRVVGTRCWMPGHWGTVFGVVRTSEEYAWFLIQWEKRGQTFDDVLRASDALGGEAGVRGLLPKHRDIRGPLRRALEEARLKP